MAAAGPHRGRDRVPVGDDLAATLFGDERAVGVAELVGPAGAEAGRDPGEEHRGHRAHR